MRTPRDITGIRFGRLVAQSMLGTNSHKRMVWLCHCDCGNICEVLSNSLLSNRTFSCGCFQKKSASERSKTHGRTKTPEYRAWSQMIQRCTNKNASNSSCYLDRGISVCERWMNFENFFLDMGIRPGKEFSIERKNNNGNYEPGNCEWATKIKQARNRRNNHLVCVNGASKTLAEWREISGLTRSQTDYQLRLGRSLESLIASKLVLV